MAQMYSNISHFKASCQNRAEMLISLCEDDCMLESFENLINCSTHTINNGGKIILCGNGGFAAIAQHTASELVGKLHSKRNPIPAIVLGTDMAVLTCIANDFGYERIFSRQLEAIGKENDMLIVLTSSGKSKNILQVLSQAKEQRIHSYAFTGNNCSDLCRELGASAIEILTNETEAIQDITMILLHILCNQIEQRLFDNLTSESKSIWQTVIEAGRENNMSTLILDRDGVVNHILPNDYIVTESDLLINEDFLSFVPVLKDAFTRIFIVTNQACIGKGIAEKAEVDKINSCIRNLVYEAGGRIDEIYTCPDADSTSLLRKPNVGLAEIILKDFPDVDFSKSIMVGDSYSDELFAKRLGAMYFNIYNI